MVRRMIVELLAQAQVTTAEANPWQVVGEVLKFVLAAGTLYAACWAVIATRKNATLTAAVPLEVQKQQALTAEEHARTDREARREQWLHEEKLRAGSEFMGLASELYERAWQFARLPHANPLRKGNPSEAEVEQRQIELNVLAEIADRIPELYTRVERLGVVAPTNVHRQASEFALGLSRELDYLQENAWHPYRLTEMSQLLNATRTAIRNDLYGDLTSPIVVAPPLIERPWLTTSGA